MLHTIRNLVGGILTIVLLLLSPQIALAQEGPGYGGKAGELNVKWNEPPTKTVIAAGPDTLDLNSNLTPETPTISVNGYGFRGKSTVILQAGSSPAQIRVRTNDAGTLETVIKDTNAYDLTTGTTILAQGRNPSGSVRTLVGAVPPPPDGGFDPATTIPLLAGIGALAAGTIWSINKTKAARKS